MNDDPILRAINGGGHTARRRRANGHAVPPTDLLEMLHRDSTGAPLPTLSNAMLIMARDPELSGLLGYDAFASQHLILRPAPPAYDGARDLAGPYPRGWQAEDCALVLAYMQRVWSPRFSKECIESAMLAEAAVRRFHPVCDWLASLRWDNTPRIDTWLTHAFGAPDDGYHRMVGARMLIAAVRRVREPGCKFDHLPVLEGGQGIGKSRSIKALFSERWFSDAMPADLTDKDAAMALTGVWGMEWAEIEHLIRTEPETIKAFLSRAVDRFRPPYGKTYVERPRQGLLIGTTNSQDYLRDATGNRRIWPIKCQWANPEWVARLREQLWAEAAVREAQGEPLWIDDSDVRDEAERHQRERMSEDLWTEAVREYCLGKTYVQIPDILSMALNIPKDRWGKREEMRVAGILQAEGWKRHLEWVSGKARRLWRPPENSSDERGG